MPFVDLVSWWGLAVRLLLDVFNESEKNNESKSAQVIGWVGGVAFQVR